ncbi:glycosyltransferase family 2 protein [Polaribacter sp. Asnod1-A03]|uniref:glycosyltransferase family 2 protein n=1 Tax=Polaribacter sp. Asnod1-A03 TaxID=3160581 RepID=UPI00386A2E0F
MTIKSKAKVSIIIPAFNAESYIEETVESVLNQSYKNIEIIIIDDYSTDNTSSILKRLEDKNLSFIKVFKNYGKGACAARNYGFELSDGDYIQYLDADDILDSLKVEKQMQLFEEFGNEIICSGVWGRFYNSPEDVKWENQNINKDYEKPIDWLVDSWNGNGMGQTSVWLTHRSLIKKAGKWNEDLTLNQDGEFFSKVLLKAKEIKFCKDAKVYYRSGNSESISQQNRLSFKKASSLLQSYELYQKNCKENMNSEKVKKSLGENYLNFIYQFYPLYPELQKRAEEKFYTLGHQKMWPVGGENFKKIGKIIGLKNALKLRSLFLKVNS